MFSKVKSIFHFSMIFFCFGHFNQANANDYSDRVFRIEVKELASPNVVSIATGFAVRSEGYVLTTFQAISMAALHPEKYEILVKIGEGSAIAQIDQFELTENIALLRVGRTFPRFLPIEEGKTTVEMGEENYLMGYSEPLSFVSFPTEYLGTKKMGYFSRFDYLIHLKKGMEGSPIINAQGNVVSMAIPVSFGKNSSSAGARLKELQRIVRTIGKSRSVASADGWKSEISTQIADAESKFEPLSLSEKKLARRSFHGISFIPPGIHSKCHIENLSKGRLKGSAYSCYEKTQLDLEENLSLMNAKFFVLNEPALESLVEDFPKINEFLGSQKGRMPSSSSSSICSIKNVQNTSNLRMIVRICSKEGDLISGMFSTIIKVNFIDDSLKGIVIHSYLNGMTYDFTMDRIADFLESIQQVKR
jgi:hypothetical protein